MAIQHFFGRFGKAFNCCGRNLAIVFSDSKIVKLKVFEFSNAGELQAVRAASQRAAVNHQQLRRSLDSVHDGFNAAANPCKTTHFGETKLVQAPCRAI